MQLSLNPVMPSSPHIWGPVLAFLLAFVLAWPARAATVQAVTGTVQLQRGQVLQPLAPGKRLREGDELVSFAGGEALIRFDDGARVALRAESTLLFKELQTRDNTLSKDVINLIEGGLRYISGRLTARQRVSFVTTTATIGIRGTDLEIALVPEPINEATAGTYLRVNTGSATLKAADDTQVDVDAGNVAVGADPEFMTKNFDDKAAPAARKMFEPLGGVFKPGHLDKLMR